MRRISPRSILSAIGLSVCFLILIFIVNNLNTHTINEEPLAVKCDCPTLPPAPPPEVEIVAAAKVEVPVAAKVEVPVAAKVEVPVAAKVEVPVAPKIEAPVVPKIDATTSTQTPPPLPPCQPIEKESPVQRAIIIYYPHHQSEYFFPEVRWYV